MDFKDLRIKLKSLVDGLVERELLEEIGNEVKDMVKTRTRKGFGVEKNLGKQERLPGLSESYKKQRRRLKRQGKLSNETTPNRSNFTKTGDTLDTIEVDANSNSVTIGPRDANKEKVKWQAKAGRKPFNLSKSENSKVLKKIEDKIKDDIKKQGL